MRIRRGVHNSTGKLFVIIPLENSLHQKTQRCMEISRENLRGQAA